MQERYLPIIYVRGYAGSDKDVDNTVNDPFYGFNSGSTHIRVGEEGTPEKFFFESPLLRLMTDYSYRPVFDDKLLSKHPRPIWIYRFYDITSPSYGSNNPIRLEMEQIAENLRSLINVVKQTTGANKVYLIAHSMGGLVCRSLIQKIYPDHGEKAEDHIDKLFTYGTPHGGIYFEVGGGLIEEIRDAIGWNNSDDFGPQRMYEYFTPKKELNLPDPLPQNFDTQSLGNAFSPDRVFCIVGTNAGDYENAGGLARKVVGSQSDGLVQIDKAYVKGAHRAYIHRTHGGRYGMVNSEEGYQNLQRFLFGDIKVKLSLSGVELSDRQNTFYQMEVRVSLRGLPTPIHEQAIDRYCPITVKLTRDKPVPLFTAFLVPRFSASGDKTCRYAIRLALHSFTRKQDWLFDSHIDKLPLWSDYLIVDVTADDGTYQARYSWNSEKPEPIIDLNLGDNIPLPPRGRGVVGSQASVKLEISKWE